MAWSVLGGQTVWGFLQGWLYEKENIHSPSGISRLCGSKPRGGPRPLYSFPILFQSSLAPSLSAFISFPCWPVPSLFIYPFWFCLRLSFSLLISSIFLSLPLFFLSSFPLSCFIFPASSLFCSPFLSLAPVQFVSSFARGSWLHSALPIGPISIIP